eukprot:gnl/TRDRNA2_/TRDRNA2_50731_c0_seq2.p1 gnl/TRDRNA2_/TRDRNA2_50731_c0~~gnl/TRDRNA2_/TRDRNA2_50731_c0_seq2.p1  ORF type:complete len:207 (-),score=57.03 gnl/TRDRNA2_/TRDRNA2_50731_c0_seq2:100-720(-)
MQAAHICHLPEGQPGTSAVMSIMSDDEDVPSQPPTAAKPPPAIDVGGGISLADEDDNDEDLHQEVVEVKRFIERLRCLEALQAEREAQEADRERELLQTLRSRDANWMGEMDFLRTQVAELRQIASDSAGAAAAPRHAAAEDDVVNMPAIAQPQPMGPELDQRLQDFHAAMGRLSGSCAAQVLQARKRLEQRNLRTNAHESRAAMK